MHVNRLALDDALQTNRNYECAVYLGEVPWCVAGRESGSPGAEQVVGQLQETDTQPRSISSVCTMNNIEVMLGTQVHGT